MNPDEQQTFGFNAELNDPEYNERILEGYDDNYDEPEDDNSPTF